MSAIDYERPVFNPVTQQVLACGERVFDATHEPRREAPEGDLLGFEAGNRENAYVHWDGEEDPRLFPTRNLLSLYQ